MSPAITRHRDAIEAACRRYRVRRLEVFGSAATGRDRVGESDIDFLVEFDSLPTGTYADHYFGLLETFETLFDRPVDLIVASSIRNPYFQESVDRTKSLVYAA